jgi:hypothetical protein
MSMDSCDSCQDSTDTEDSNEKLYIKAKNHCKQGNSIFIYQRSILLIIIIIVVGNYEKAER